MKRVNGVYDACMTKAVMKRREAAGAALAQHRESRGMSLREVADASRDENDESGVSPMTMSYLERGLRKPRDETIAKVEAVLQLPAGTYKRLLSSDNPFEEVRKAAAEFKYPRPRLVPPTEVVVNRRSPISSLLGLAGGNLESLNTLMANIPPESDPARQPYLSSLINKCIHTLALLTPAWRYTATDPAADAGDADRLLEYLRALESTRLQLADLLEPTSLSAQLDVACRQSSLPDQVIAELLGATVEELWVWRNGDLDSDATDVVQAFISCVHRSSGRDTN